MNQHVENGKKRKLRNYTKEQKEEAVEDALEIGNSASARMHGIPLTTLSGWVKYNRQLQAPRGCVLFAECIR